MRKMLLLSIFLFVAMIIHAREYEYRKNIDYSGEALVDVNMDIGLGNIELYSMNDKNYIVKAYVKYRDKECRPIVEYIQLGPKGKLKIRSQKVDKKSFLGSRSGGKGGIKNNWYLSFSTLIKYTFNINIGLGSGKMDFTNLKIKDLSLNVGLSDVDVIFDDLNKEVMNNFELATGLGDVTVYNLLNSNAEEFKIDCGMGNTVVYLKGLAQKSVRGYLTVGLGSMTVKIPREYAVEVKADRSFLSSLSIDGFYEFEDGFYRSDNWEKSNKKIRLYLEIGLGSINIEWID